MATQWLRRAWLLAACAPVLLLAACGAALGVAASYGILAGIKAVLPRYAFAPEVVIRINLPVLAFSVGAAIASLRGGSTSVSSRSERRLPSGR